MSAAAAASVPGAVAGRSRGGTWRGSSDARSGPADGSLKVPAEGVGSAAAEVDGPGSSAVISEVVGLHAVAERHTKRTSENTRRISELGRAEFNVGTRWRW